MSDDERRKAAFTAIEELMSAFKELDPLQGSLILSRHQKKGCDGR